MSSFLWSGYFLDYRSTRINIDTSGITKKRYEKVPRQELIELGAVLFRESIASRFDINKDHVVPLSGGLDSRAILAGLLEHTEARNIHTYTFGTPGTLDYDIGNFVAGQLGTDHTSFDLTRHVYKQEELEDISRRVDRQTILFHHAPVWEVAKKFCGCVSWSGFLGDPLTGSHLLDRPSESMPEAKARFIERNRYVKSVDLRAKNANLADFVQCELIGKETLTLDEQLDFNNRQTKFVAPHVLMQGFEYELPFLYQPWIDFILSVDNQYRHKQSLYYDILRKAFPTAFSYKTKSNRGQPLGASVALVSVYKGLDRIRSALGMPSRSINYIDFNRQIRQKLDLRQVVSSNVLDLHKRGLVDWIDVPAILSKHMRGDARHGDALVALASLEVHFKSGSVL
ncbi:MAG: asparagine synthase-related protein [Steroidobacteraceae bacterium]